MTDYLHTLEFGAFLAPTSQDPSHVLNLAQLTESAGLDLVTFQDHPYQPAFLDTWTLLSYVASRTETVRLAGNVLNLPLRGPAMIARAVASLDLLSGGRVELGLGAGAFWDAIEAMGADRLTPAESVTALSEGIDIIRGLWDTSTRDRLAIEGEIHRVDGPKRGPAPAHEVQIWLGALKPRMLRLTGTKADGWLPSLGYMRGLDQLTESNAIINDAASAAGRDPADIRRLLNIGGALQEERREKLLTGPPEQWAEQLAELAVDYGMSTFILSGDDPHAIVTFGQEVAPATRELVAKARGL